MGMYISIDKNNEKIQLTNDERVHIVHALYNIDSATYGGNQTVRNLADKIEELHQMDISYTQKEIRKIAVNSFRNLWDDSMDTQVSLVRWIKKMRDNTSPNCLGLKECKQMCDLLIDEGWFTKREDNFIIPDMVNI